MSHIKRPTIIPAHQLNAMMVIATSSYFISLVRVLHRAGKVSFSEVLFYAESYLHNSSVTLLVSVFQDCNSKKRKADMAFIEILFLIKPVIKDTYNISICKIA